MGLEGVSRERMNQYADILYAAFCFLGLVGICLIAAGLFIRRRSIRSLEDKTIEPAPRIPESKPIEMVDEGEDEDPDPEPEPIDSPTNAFIPAQLLDSVDISETVISPKAIKQAQEEEEGMVELPPFPAPPPLPAPPPTTSGFFPMGKALEEDLDDVGEDDATVLVQRNPPKRI
jgi:hypothetical protein